MERLLCGQICLVAEGCALLEAAENAFCIYHDFVDAQAYGGRKAVAALYATGVRAQLPVIRVCLLLDMAIRKSLPQEPELVA
jgi:hypothetical protein